MTYTGTTTAHQLEADDSPSAEAIRWSDQYLLGHEQMDDLHEEFVGLVGRLQIASNEEIESLLDALLAHAQQHFGEEDRWMESTGFPPRDCHMKEHASVLASIQQVHDQAAMGIYVFCRPFANELANWFPGHADQLDSALSHWLSKLRYGGKPVVIRRKVTDK